MGLMFYGVRRSFVLLSFQMKAYGSDFRLIQLSYVFLTSQLDV
jgi:hypothetical protein